MVLYERFTTHSRPKLLHVLSLEPILVLNKQHISGAINAKRGVPLGTKTLFSAVSLKPTPDTYTSTISGPVYFELGPFNRVHVNGRPVTLSKLRAY